MSSVLTGTTYVLPDEPCCFLAELNELSPDFKSLRRYQIIHVIRNDRIAEYRTDLGPASTFKATEIQFVGGVRDGKGMGYIDETVGSMKEMADQHRANIGRDMDRPIPVLNLLEAYANLKG